jgi:hypothetical protein
MLSILIIIQYDNNFRSISRRARYRILINSEGEIKNGQSRGTGNIWYGTQDEEKQNKNTTQYVLDTAIRKQTQKRRYKVFFNVYI